MMDFPFNQAAPVYLEISHGFLKAARDGNRVELPLERGPDGRLTAACRARLTGALGVFVNPKLFRRRARAICALSAAGVSLRRLTLPASAKTEFEKVLRLQIEVEFPLPPEELAWGYLPLETGTTARREVLVAAVKQEVIADYADLLTVCGLEPVFTLAAQARNFLCPQPGGSHALLDVGGDRPEWALFENGIPTAMRILPAAAEVPLRDSVPKAPGAGSSGRKIYLSGAGNELAAELNRRLGGGIECVPPAVQAGAGMAILGLQKAVAQNGGAQLLMLGHRRKPSAGVFDAGSPELKPWLAWATVLLCLLLILPYAEALALKPFLARKLFALNADKQRLATIDRELDFLQSLKQNQPPYLDALFVLAKSAPPGTRFDSLTMDRQGEVSLHGTMQNGLQVTDFRAKLIGSGFFSNVEVGEQTPAPDGQRVNLRMTAHWKPAATLVGLAIGPSADEIQQARSNRDTAASDALPPGLPPFMR